MEELCVSFCGFRLYTCPSCNCTRPPAHSTTPKFHKTSSWVIKLNPSPVDEIWPCRGSISHFKRPLSWVLIRASVRKTHTYIQLWFPLRIGDCLYRIPAPPRPHTHPHPHPPPPFFYFFILCFWSFWVSFLLFFLFASLRSMKTAFSFIFLQFLGAHQPP